MKFTVFSSQTDTDMNFYKACFFVTTQVGRLKLFRLKAEGSRKAQLPHFGEETAYFCIKHAFKVRIPQFLITVSRR